VRLLDLRAALIKWPAPGSVDARLASFSLLFKVSGAEIAQRRVTPAQNVEAFDIIEDIGLGFVPGSLGFAPRAFGFQRGKEALQSSPSPHYPIEQERSLRSGRRKTDMVQALTQ
jgi:hypothetical protein